MHLKDTHYDELDDFDFDDMTDEELELMSKGPNAGKLVKAKNTNSLKKKQKSFKDSNKRYR